MRDGIESRLITSRDEWLEWRKQDITASAAAALLDMHPYITPLQLYMDKKEIVSLDGADNPAMRRGRLLESVALTCLREMKPEWQVHKSERYLRDPRYRIGCTPDFELVDEAGRPGICQAKSVEPGVFERFWMQDGEVVPPVWIGIQAAVEAHLTGAEFATIGVLRVGHGVEFDLIDVPDTPGLIERLQGAADAFWDALAKDQPPEPQYLADADLVRRLYPEPTPKKIIDVGGNNRIAAMAAEYEELGKAAKAAEQGRKALKAELLAIMKDAEVAMADGRVVATALMVEKRAEEKPRAAQRYRDIKFK